MNKWMTIMLMTVVTVLTVGSGILEAQSGVTVSRHRADRLAMGFEIATPATIAGGGLNFYTEPIFLAGNRRTVYITFVASADSHGGARLLMKGEVDGEACTAVRGPLPQRRGGSPST